jgi:amidase
LALPDLGEMDRMEKLAYLNTLRAELREVYRKMWVRHDLDVCIAPSAQNTAVAHDMFAIAPYTTLFNCLDVCCNPFKLHRAVQH